MIVEVHHVDCQPLILVLALRELHSLSQTTPTQCSFSILSQLVACRSLRSSSWSELVAALINGGDEGSHLAWCRRG